MSLKDFLKRLEDQRVKRLIKAVAGSLQGNLPLTVIGTILLYVMQEDEEEGLSSIDDILSRLPLPKGLEVGEKEAIYRALSVIRWVLTKGRDKDIIKLSDLIVSEPKEAARRIIALYKEGAEAYNEKELEDVQGYVERIFEMVKENENLEGVRMFREWLRQ